MASEVHLALPNVEGEVEFMSQKLIDHIIHKRAELTALKSEVFWLLHLVTAQHQRLFGHDGYGSTNGDPAGQARAMARIMLATMSHSVDARGNGDGDAECTVTADRGAHTTVGPNGTVDGDGEDGERCTTEDSNCDTEEMVDADVLKGTDA